MSNLEITSTLSRKAAILQICESQSHELVSGLTTAREFIATILDGLLGEVSDRHREHLSAATGCIDDCREALETIVTVVQLESERIRVDLRSVDVVSLLKRAIAEGRKIAAKKELHFEYEYDMDLPEARADRELIAEVLNKLILNAVHLSPERGVISVSVTTDTGNDDQMRISIASDGVQDDQYLEGAFDLFRCAMQNDGAGGPLLAMVACKELIELQGGLMWAESTKDHKTKFCFTLPCAISSSEVNVAELAREGGV